MFIPNPFLMFNDAGGDNGGGSEASAAASAGTEATETAATTTEATSTDTGATTATTAPWGDAENFNADTAAKLIENLRNEVKSTKSGFETQLAEATTKASTEATEKLTRSLGEALGLIKPEAEADPAKLLADLQTTHTATTQERDDALGRARSLQVANTVLLRAGDLKANAAALLDSRELEGKLSVLDPAADDYASQVDAVITAAVENDPQRFGNIQAAAQRSGGDMSAGNAKGADQLTIQELRAMTPTEQLQAHKEGRTRTLTNG